MILRLKPFFLSPWSLPATVLFWAIVIYVSFINRSAMLGKIELEMARIKGESVFHLVQTTRRWNTMHGAVYVPETDESPANPYLFVPEKNIQAPSGKSFTQINPAYMTRQLADLLDGSAVEIHLTSQRLLNPNNAPDEWELQALNQFENTGAEYVEEQVGQSFRYMAPLYIEPGCQACHFGYAVGDIRGGISVTFPKTQITGITSELRKEMIHFHLGAFFILSLVGIFLAVSIRKLLISMNNSEKLTQLNIELAYEHDRQLKMAEELTQTRIKAEKASAAKSDFLATMSHEVRTPMNAIMGLLEILSRDDLPAKQQGLIKIIRQSAGVLLRILDDILDFSRLEAGRINLETIPTRLEDILSGVTTVFQPMCQERGVQFKAEIDPDVPEYVHADPVRISQILHNLISNAVKFSSKNKDQSGQVLVRLSWLDEQLEITVKDNGIGISSEQQAKILQPFVQAEISTTRQFGGSGLGLSIVQKLTHMMGGQLKIDSELGQGSTFAVILPLLKLNATEMENLVEPPNKFITEAVDEPSQFHLLVAEDDQVNQLVIAQQLEKIGYRYTMVNDGAEAFAAWQTSPQGFDLIVTDLHMPVMDGISLIQSIRAIESDNANIPIIILTANVLSEVQDMKELKLSGQLTKPVHLNEFALTLQQALKYRQANQMRNSDHREQSKINELPLYDPDALKQVVGDDPDTIKELQQTYVRISAEQMSQLERLWQTPQSDKRVMLLHKLKSSSRSTGALYLGQRFEHYELLSRKEAAALNIDEWKALKADYEKALELLRKDIER